MRCCEYMSRVLHALCMYFAFELIYGDFYFFCVVVVVWVVYTVFYSNRWIRVTCLSYRSSPNYVHNYRQFYSNRYLLKFYSA